MPFTVSGNWWYFDEDLHHVYYKEKPSVSDIVEVSNWIADKFKMDVLMVDVDEEEKDNS